MIYLVILQDDETTEILSAWSTQALAEADVERRLAAEREREGARGHYWLAARLNITELPIDGSP